MLLPDAGVNLSSAGRRQLDINNRPLPRTAGYSGGAPKEACPLPDALKAEMLGRGGGGVESPAILTDPQANAAI